MGDSSSRIVASKSLSCATKSAAGVTLRKALGQRQTSELCGGSSQHRSGVSCPVTCSEHCGVAVSLPAPMSPHVTKGPLTPCPVPCHGDHAAPCHNGPLHTLPPALGTPSAHPKWPRLEGIPWPKCQRLPNRNVRNGSNHQQMLPCSAGSGHLGILNSGNLSFPIAQPK